MKPPRSVWVVVSDKGVAQDAGNTKDDVLAAWSEPANVVRYVLPTKPRGRKPRKRRRGNGGGA